MPEYTPNPTNLASTLHQAALRAGLTDTIPVMPPNAPLHEHSKVDPKARGKVPGDFYNGAWDGMGNWPDYQMNERAAIRWDALGANVGLKMGHHWVGLDLDVTDALLAQAMRQYMDTISGGYWPVRTGAFPKILYLFKVAGEPITRRQYPMRMEGVEERQLVEVMGQSSKGRPTQAVIFGTHPTGVPYQWNMDVHAGVVPACTQQQMDNMIAGLMGVAVERGWKLGRPSLAGGVGDGTGSDHGAEAFDMSLVPEVSP